MKAWSVCSLSLAALTSVAFAFETQFVDPGDTNPREWGVAANWVDTSTREAPALPPGLSAETTPDDVIFPELAKPAMRVVHTTKDTDGKSPTDASFLPKINPVIGTLTGPWYWTINVSQPTDGSGQAKRWIKVKNPDGFDGNWSVDNGKAGYYLTADAGETGVFQSFDTRSRPFLSVVNATATAKVENLSGNGMLLVNENGAGTADGAGTVEICNTSGGNQKMVVSAGAVSLSPLTDADAENVFAKAYLHVDASDASTFLQEVGADGRTYVTNWLDVRKNGMKAVPYDKPGAVCPFRDASVKSPTGRELLDFGALVPEDVETYGPTNCVLQFPRTTEAREIFYVAKYQRAAVAKDYPGAVGDTNTNDLHPDSGKLFGGAAHDNAKNGELQYNGIRCAISDTVYNTIRLHDLCQIGIGCVGNISVSLLGATRYDPANKRTGGVRIGEVLVYTQQLTRVERMYVARYLNRKWFGDIDADFGFVEIRNNRPLGVGAGAVAKIADLVTTGADGLKKTGAGTLEVSRLSPQGSDVELQDGALTFAAAPTIPTETPTDGAYLWLDANALADGDLSGGHLATWTDCRPGVSLAATTYWADTSHTPTLLSNASGSLAAVDLGLKSKDTHAAIKFPNWGSADTYAMYMVFRQKIVGNDTRAIFGGKKAAWLRQGAGRLMGNNIQYPAAASALWTLNGKPIDPYGTYAQLNQTNEFVVVGVNSPVALALEGIANCGGTGGQTGNFEGGNLEVGEVLVYKRTLTDEERLATEAYLLNRWLGVAHPRTGTQQLGAVTVASGKTLSVGGAADVTVDKVSGGNGAIVKLGPGTVTLTPDAAAITSVTVAGGTLTLNPPDLTKDALFHFDASDEDSLTTYDGQDVGGEAVEYVAGWKDTDGRAVSTVRATSTYFSITNPTLKQVAMGGTLKPTIDFGGYTKTEPAGKGYTTNNASLNLSTRFTNVREAHLICADNPLYRACWFLSDTSAHDFNRTDANFNGTTGEYVGPAAGKITTSAKLKGDYTGFDGTNVAYDAVYPEGFHLLSWSLTNDVTVGAFMNDRSLRSGGGYISEVIAFDEKLPLAKRAFLQQQMMHKWLGADAPVWANEGTLTELTVAEGATFNAPGWAFTATKVGGGGTINAASLSGFSAIDVTRLDTASPAVTLTATVSVSTPLTVTVTPKIPKSDGVVVYKLAKGLPADSAAGAELIADYPTSRAASLFMAGDTLCLRVQPRGLLIMVK